MLINVKDAKSNEYIAINPDHVVSVFIVPEGEDAGKVAIILTAGNVLVKENYLDLVGRLNGELK